MKVYRVAHSYLYQEHHFGQTNLGSAMLRTTSDDIECGMWNVECGVMYGHEK
jgi:hypothetical protein